MRTNHTPGPWVALERYTNRQAVPVGRRRDSMAHDIFAEAHGPNCEANARLIAAAPELLAALAELLKPGHCPPALSQSEWMALPWMIAARQAVNKATGEQP